MAGSKLKVALRRVANDLVGARAEFALVGGVAVSARTEPRFTRDIDFAVRVASDAEAEALIIDLGYRIIATAENLALGRLATVRLLSPAPRHNPPVIDLLFASSSIEPEVVASAQLLHLSPTLELPVARPELLLAMKLLSEKPARPQDAMDILALLRVLDEEELDVTRSMLDQISRRGAHRGKDLRATLEHFVELTRGEVES
ncbi:MAG: nucleotidyl transferase AbiEii/AbiGii toxin family protein [Deltaproteobacteria bacterium]|nr:nucleotidyl transferase AbiEii/AbiGii toxin family protein [Deltaproteobacteria bacterium]